MKQNRMYNYELLRVFAMILIILLHSLSYGGVREHYQINDFGYIIMNSLRGFAYLGVNCFVMITGWFMCDKTFRFKRIASIWLQVVFYGIVSFIILILITKQIHLNAIINVFMPISKQNYWFVNCYILLICLQPLLNLVINKADKKQLKRFVIAFIFMFSVVPTFMPWSKKITSSGTDISWFITIYMFIAYIKKWGGKTILRKKWVGIF